MSKEIMLYLLTFMLFTSTLVPVGAAEVGQSLSCGTEAWFLAERSMYVLAVAQENGRYVGTPSVLTVKVCRGSGVVYVSAMPLSEVDVQASARMAALIASYIAGTDYFSYDYYICIKANTTIVGGPSAGAAMTVALVAALLNKSIDKSVVITGMILPDGTIGAVGGVPEKLEAAVEVGAKTMLIPLGQRESLSLSKGEYVDVVELGRKEGVRVVEVATIFDALKWFGINIRRPAPEHISLPESALTIVKGWVSKFRNSYTGLRRSLLSMMSMLPEEKLGSVEELLSKAEEFSSRGGLDLSAGRYYSAASDYFVAVINIDAAFKLACIELGNLSVDELVDEAEKKLSLVSNEYYKLLSSVGDAIDINELAILTEVASRIDDAEGSFKSLRSAIQNESLSDIVWKAAYVTWRSESALDWMRIADLIDRSGISVKLSDVRESASVLIYYARTSASYIESLTGYAGVSSILQLVNKAEDYLDTDIFRALALATRLMAQVTSVLDSAFTKNASVVADVLRNESLIAVVTCVRRGFTPIAALAYIERGDSMRGYSSTDSVYFYELALVTTRGYLIIASQGLEGQAPNLGMPAGMPGAQASPGILTGGMRVTWVTLIYVVVISISALIALVYARWFAKLGR